MKSRPTLVKLALVNRPAAVVTLLAMISVLAVTFAQDAQAQTFSVLHNFTGGLDGKNPYAGVTLTRSGVLYGTASNGGANSVGTVFKLSHVNAGWVISPLYEFTGGNTALPLGGIAIGPDSALYGTTFGDGAGTFGTAYELTPPPSICSAIRCYWNAQILHTFMGVSDGSGPQTENLVFDSAGNIYGTTAGGGMYDSGVTFELTRSGQGYMASILHNFGNETDGRSPLAGIVFDTMGNMYGTTNRGGTGSPQDCHSCGTVYQLMPSSNGWTENILVNFDGTNGNDPYGNLIVDPAQNLYGTAAQGGQNGGGVVFKLTNLAGGFTYSVLYSFSSCGSRGGLAMDTAGNFFGVCYSGGANQDGWVFELTNCEQTCSVVDLHDFSGSDGMSPYGGPVLDGSGNLYGTTFAGGTGCAGGCGVVWEIAGVAAPRKD